METLIEKNPEIKQDRKIADHSKDHIPGWGMDADPENDPTYPMKHRTGADHERLNYEKAPQQPIDIEVFHSIERPNVTRVFGTATPPQAVSGAIRRYAYKNFSESTATHWMMLILADRVNVVEGLIQDLAHGHVPNLWKERGLGAEWKYNKKGFIRGAVIRTAAVVGAVMVYRAVKNKSRS